MTDTVYHVHWAIAQQWQLVYFSKAETTAGPFRLRRSVYVCPVPTNTIGWPVVYVMEMAAPT